MGIQNIEVMKDTPEQPCSLCGNVATCTVNGKLLCEGHGMYWSKINGKPMIRNVNR
jgi:hypothetical protein